MPLFFLVPVQGPGSESFHSERQASPVTASSGGRLRPDFQAAHFNAAELEASAKIVEKAV
jgi:hypothetical protein